jgi:transcriptional regulator with PAS, ATPase and Fis domain
MKMTYQGDLIGEHSSIAETRRLILKVAKSATQSVLIYGETGTGKGLVARMLHEQSARAQSEFIDINCAAIPANLMESELFGYEKGAFTGALQKKTGLIEAANNGTMFLDEIRELDPVLQAKLLSLLDTQRFRRVGAVNAIEVDVRFIAASNKILSGEVRDGRFRDDLYYRLQVVSINIPPLRNRGDDMFVLSEHFIRKFNARYKRSITGWEPSVADVFRNYAWPGNVRELENLLERIFILEEEDQILVSHIPPRILREVGKGPGIPPGPLAAGLLKTPSVMVGETFHAATAAFQEALIENALRETHGGLSAAADLLGLSRHALRHHMKKLGINS